MRIGNARQADLPAILALQRLAFQSEARMAEIATFRRYGKPCRSWKRNGARGLC